MRQTLKPTKYNRQSDNSDNWWGAANAVHINENKTYARKIHFIFLDSFCRIEVVESKRRKRWHFPIYVDSFRQPAFVVRLVLPIMAIPKVRENEKFSQEMPDILCAWGLSKHRLCVKDVLGWCRLCNINSEKMFLPNVYVREYSQKFTLNALTLVNGTIVTESIFRGTPAKNEKWEGDILYEHTYLTLQHV